jgi:hypothetical protein
MRRLFGNTLSLLGVLVAGSSFLVNVFLLLVDSLAARPNPYVGILTYMVIPGVTFFGLFLIVLGAVLRYLRLRRGIEDRPLPRLDLNDGRQRLLLAGSFFLLVLFLGFSAVGGYQAYQFTESVVFCGQVCHRVMEPEFTAYQTSPHARVSCAECHIGPGAEWFVKSKLSGAYQVYSVLFNKYSRPIPTPIQDLRPAQETCEHCHWPAKFWGEQLATRVHFSSDERNTRREVSLLLKTGGGAIEGLSHGIHWHMNIANKVSYVATDDRRQEIPWVRLEEPNGRVTEFLSTEKPITREQLERGELRRMDCMDCHNRPSHVYLPPGRALDLPLLAGRIPQDLPFIKKVGVEAMVQPYATTAEAEAGIAKAVRGFYQQRYPREAASWEPRIVAAIQEIVLAYRQNFFPYMRVNWLAYPNNIGHKEFPGCFRCHDGKHVSKDGRVISHECGACHDFLEQRKGAFVRVPATPAFAHPWPLAGRHAEVLCGACHTGGPAKPATCRGCHGIPASGAPMAAMECRECHQKSQQREPLADCQACHKRMVGLHRHEAHRGADCTTCHPAHGWTPAPREQCMACHQDKTEHYAGEPCAACHEFRP